jgi:uncharacterized membrane protein YbaN (DUF454 family)
LHLALAAVFFALAVLGALLPLLPATPFVLLTSWCLVRSSPRLDAKLRRSPFFGALLEDWEKRRGVRRGVKVVALIALSLAVASSLLLGDLGTAARWILLALAAVGAAVILRLPTVRDDAVAR